MNPHPRLLMTPELLQRKKAEMATDTANDGRWKTLKRVADSSAMTETSREWLPTLAAMSLLTDDPKYSNRAAFLITNQIVTSRLALVTPDRGKPVGAEVFQLALAYDWLFGRMTPNLTTEIEATLRQWGNWVWPETNPARVGAWGIDAPWDNYWMSFLLGSWMAGLALSDDALISLSRQKWQRGLAWILEHEPGGYLVEGSTYGCGSVLALLQTLCANKTATGEELHPWFQSALNTTFQLTTPGMGAKLPYGDAASDYKAIHSDTDRFIALLMAQFGGRAADAKAWLDGISRNRSKRAQSLWFEYLYYPT